MRNPIIALVRENPLQLLLPLSIVAIILHLGDCSSTVTMAVAALAMIPMASLIGDGIEALAVQTGQRWSPWMVRPIG